MRQYRLGVVSYFNAKPLVYHLEHHPRDDVTLIADVPSRLVQRLRDGDLDAGLVSSIACFEDDRLEILGGTGIAARERVDSIRLFCKVAPDRVRRVALDVSSRTAQALVRILLVECFDARPEYTQHPPDLGAMLASADAALLIGDPALQACHGAAGLPAGLRVLDLGEVWYGLTGLPFVFALWAARRGTNTGPLAGLLAEARELGRRHLDAMAAEAAERLQIPASVCREYFHHVMVYDLGDEEWEGLRRFRSLAIRHGLAPTDAPPLSIEGG